LGHRIDRWCWYGSVSSKTKAGRGKSGWGIVGRRKGKVLESSRAGIAPRRREGGVSKKHDRSLDGILGGEEDQEFGEVKKGLGGGKNG